MIRTLFAGLAKAFQPEPPTIKHSLQEERLIDRLNHLEERQADRQLLTEAAQALAMALSVAQRSGARFDFEDRLALKEAQRTLRKLAAAGYDPLKLNAGGRKC